MAGERSFAKLGGTLADLSAAWPDRLFDAEALNAAGRHASAIAMGVYALEIYLKVRICQRLNLAALPRPFEVHDLEGLLVLSGLRAAMDRAPPEVQDNWEQLTEPSDSVNTLRYSASTVRSSVDTTAVFFQLRDPTHGILPWLTTQA